MEGKVYKNKKEMMYFSIHIIFFILAGMIIFEFLSEIINKFFSLESRAPFVMDFENFVFSIINAPIAEEVIFRKWTSDFLKKKTKYYNIIQALIFALWHRYFIQKIYTFILGVFLGNVKDKKGNIWLCIYLHMLFNITGIYLKDFYLGFIDSIIKMLNMENNLLFMTIVFIIMFILHTAGFIWSLKKIGKGFYKLF